ncbi:MAG: reverse transcriptase domain-containing protein [Cyclobacteriaceae bacterium]
MKIAKSRNKHHLLNYLTSNPKYKYHLKSLSDPGNEFEQYQKELNDLLSSILPPRRKWVKLGEASRRHPQNKNEFLTANDKNFYSLLKTIKIHEKRNSKESWFLKLQEFIEEIKKLALRNTYEVNSPVVLPKLKEEKKKKDKNECRPICLFDLKDRIILSITNKFLTQLFDNYFQDSSYAFRSKKNNEGKIISHHDCVRDIIDFRKKNDDKELIIVECDMKKFFDTVNQDITKALYQELIILAQKDHPDLNIESASRIFESYLDCFAFNVNIPKPDDNLYWESYAIPNGEFTWISNSELLKKYPNNISDIRIGIPQGGALSGLISNIYLNQVDIHLSHEPILYQRFCDDMIIIGDTINDCNNAKAKYISALNDLKLFPHPFISSDELTTERKGKVTYKNFWSGKSKGPYRWGKIEENSFPWIGFVGYEINYTGDLRVRKKSLIKELKKQKKIVREIEEAIDDGMRRSSRTATESAINRLIGMSVGRIGIDNFDEVSTDLCWKNGFKELNLNTHSEKQIKHLDRNRSKLYYRLLKEVKEPELKAPAMKGRQIISYNKPFSYYYQVLERSKKANG